MPQGLHPGAHVRVVGLQGATQLNGCEGICRAWDPESGRWTVRLNDSGEKALRPDNLEIVARLTPGVEVKIVGLVGAAHLNGSVGCCVSWQPETGRWIVSLSGGVEKAIKPENLELERGPGARPPPNMAHLMAAVERTRRERENLAQGLGHSRARRSRSRSPPGGEQVISFGRHTGRSFSEVFLMEGSYCEWTLRQYNPSGPLREFQDWLRQQMMRGALPSQAPAPPPVVGWSARQVKAGTFTAWGVDLQAYLAKLPRMRYDAKRFSGAPYPQACPICMENWEAVTAEIVLTPCFHVFHAPCLAGWLMRNKECPSCRWDVSDTGEDAALDLSAPPRPGPRPLSAETERVELIAD